MRATHECVTVSAQGCVNHPLDTHDNTIMTRSRVTPPWPTFIPMLCQHHT